jgi:hypothetical protein
MLQWVNRIVLRGIGLLFLIEMIALPLLIPLLILAFSSKVERSHQPAEPARAKRP